MVHFSVVRVLRLTDYLGLVLVPDTQNFSYRTMLGLKLRLG